MQFLSKAFSTTLCFAAGVLLQLSFCKVLCSSDGFQKFVCPNLRIYSSYLKSSQMFSKMFPQETLVILSVLHKSFQVIQPVHAYKEHPGVHWGIQLQSQ